jgi:hypothetical protein
MEQRVTYSGVQTEAKHLIDVITLIIAQHSFFARICYIIKNNTTRRRGGISSFFGAINAAKT